MKEKQRRGEANFTEAREAGGRSPEREGRREIRAGRQPQSHPERGTGVPPVNVANLGTSSTGLALHCSTRPGRPCPILKQQGRPRRESGTPAARHPSSFDSLAPAPLVRSVIPVVSNTAPTTKPPGGGEEAHRRWPGAASGARARQSVALQLLRPTPPRCPWWSIPLTLTSQRNFHRQSNQ